LHAVIEELVLAYSLMTLQAAMIAEFMAVYVTIIAECNVPGVSSQQQQVAMAQMVMAQTVA
jgi:hypothetical protein